MSRNARSFPIDALKLLPLTIGKKRTAQKEHII
jgi:hypothetical protein